MPDLPNRNDSIDSGSCLPEDQNRLVTINSSNIDADVALIIDSLKKDQVVLMKNLAPDEADSLMSSVAGKFGLSETLEIQAAYAASLGHRENIGRYYMSVNKRDDYQFVAPHSEGSSFTNMQLASFYCYENSTDGGETILMNVDPSCEIWHLLREKVKRGKAERPLTPGEIRKIKMLARLSMPEDTLKEDDEILEQSPLGSDFTLFSVLAKPQKTYSKVLNREVYAFWDTIGSIDDDSGKEFDCFLRKHNLLKLPPDNINIKTLDESSDRSIRSFGSRFDQLFKCSVTRKLEPGDFMIQNNLTWTHAVNNWTPGSGARKVVAAFA